MLAIISSATICSVLSLIALHATHTSEVLQARATLEHEVEARLPDLARSLRIEDEARVEAALGDLARIRGVTSLSLRSTSGRRWPRGAYPGEPFGSQSDTTTMPVRYREGSELRALAELTVTFRFADVEAAIRERRLIALAALGAASVVSGIAIVVLFQWLVGRHLRGLARFLASAPTGPASRRFVLQRSRRRWWSDELDQVQTELNRRLETEQRMRDTERRLLAALDDSHDGYALLGQNRQLAYLNAEYRRLSDERPEKLVRGATIEPISGDGAPPFEAAGGRDRHEPFDLQRGDGTWVRVKEETLADGGSFHVLSDVTHGRQLEEELARYRNHLEELVEERTTALDSVQQELIKAERLAAIGQLTGTVSHELRNPLGTIRSSFTTVRRLVSGQEGAREVEPRLARALARIERNIDRCVLIIDELLEYGRARELHRTRFDLGPWLRALLEEHPIPARVTLAFDVPDGLEALVDADRLQQALDNIIQNAWQSMIESFPAPHQERSGAGAPVGSAPAADAGSRENPPAQTGQGAADVATESANGRRSSNPAGTVQPLRLEVTARGDVDRIEISVADTGPGIAQDDIEHIFEPLFSTRSFGVGLGLPLVRRILEEHRGGVSVESDPGELTTFTLWLPAAAPALAPDQAAGSMK